MAKKKATEKNTPVITMYIGKPIKGLPQNTVFIGGQLPAHIEELVNKDDIIAHLIVPVDEVQEARKNMLVKGHILNHYFMKQTIKE